MLLGGMVGDQILLYYGGISPSQFLERSVQKINLKDLLKYIESKKIALGICTDGDEYKNRSERTLEKKELLRRIEERKQNLDS